MRVHLLRGLVCACAAALPLLAGCGGGSEGVPPAAAPVMAPAADYYPLGAGDRWLYGDTTVRVCGTRAVGGETATVLHTLDSLGAVLDESLFVKGEGGVRKLVADDAGAFERAVGPLQQMRWPLVVGSAFTQLDKTVDSGLDLDGDGRGEPMKILSVVVVQGLEAVDVPAGHFEHCVHLRTLVTQTLQPGAPAAPIVFVSTGDEWFAPDVGIVKGEYLVVQPGQMWSGARALLAYAVAGRRSEDGAPAVTSLSPADGSRAGAGTVVAVGFSEDMDIVSLREGGLQVMDASGQPVAGSISGGKLRANFVPLAPWAAGRYTGLVTTTATDRVGNPLGAARVWSFEVDPAYHPWPDKALSRAPRPAPAPPTSAR
jgi:Bacterial Ig-like domain